MVLSWMVLVGEMGSYVTSSALCGLLGLALSWGFGDFALGGVQLCWRREGIRYLGGCGVFCTSVYFVYLRGSFTVIQLRVDKLHTNECKQVHISITRAELI